MKKELGLFVLLIVLCCAVVCVEIWQQLHDGATWSELTKPRFLTAINLTNLATRIGLYGVFSLGLGLVIITGGIDLSVGSMIALIGVMLSIALTEWKWGWVASGLLVVAIPMALGWVHGVLITRAKVQPFIVTLCGLMIYRSLARYIADDGTKGFGNAEGFKGFASLANGKIFGLPSPFVILLLFSVILWFVLHRSVYGRYLFAVGRNEDAARFSGINTRAVITASYVLLGALTGMAGILWAFYTNSISPSNHGNSFELYGIAAAVLGGCSLRGGEGSIIGILIGTTLLQVLENLVNLLGIKSSLTLAVMGAVVLIGVLADQFFQARAAKKLVRH
jgi:ribose transport system permease protein